MRAALFIILLLSGCIAEDAPPTTLPVVKTTTTTVYVVPTTATPPPPPTTTTLPAACAHETHGRLPNCLYKLALEEDDTALCDLIEKIPVHSACMKELALARNDSSLCLFINVTYRPWCDAVTSGDPLFCSDIGLYALRRDCLGQMAELLGDASLCENTTPECWGIVARILGDATICTRVGNPARDICLHQVSQKFADPTGCYLIREPRMMDLCFSGANSTLDCGSITEYNHTQWCKKENAKLPQDCDALSSPLWRDRCHYHLAISRIRPSLCKAIEGKELANLCYRDIANISQDPAVCHNIRHGTLRDICFEELGILKRDAAICDMASSNASSCGRGGCNYPRFNCFWNVAVATGNITICERTEHQYRDYCAPDVRNPPEYLRDSLGI